MERLETSYRSVIKHMLAVPDNTPSCSIYLVSGLFPAEAQRDLDIMGLLGQLAICSKDLQNVTDIIHHNLVFYCSKFGGWSGLVRKTAEKYSLPDPGAILGDRRSERDKQTKEIHRCLDISSICLLSFLE